MVQNPNFDGSINGLLSAYMKGQLGGMKAFGAFVSISIGPVHCVSTHSVCEYSCILLYVHSKQ